MPGIILWLIRRCFPYHEKEYAGCCFPTPEQHRVSKEFKKPPFQRGDSLVKTTTEEYIKFSATLQRGPTGFGLECAQHLYLGYIGITHLYPELQIVRVVEEQYDGSGLNSGGKLAVNDRLVGIDDLDVSTWTEAEVIEKVKSFDSHVTLHFKRKVKKAKMHSVHKVEDQVEIEQVEICDKPTWTICSMS